MVSQIVLPFLFVPKLYQCSVNVTAEIMNKLQTFDVWKTSHQSIQALASTRSEEQRLISTLANCIVLINDINLEANKWQLQDYRYDANLQADSFFTQFQTYDAISSKIDEWVHQYPKFAAKISIGKTVQGRDIICLKVSSYLRNRTKKSVIWSGGIHAREWAGPATVMFIADRLLKGKRKWLEHFDFHICPSQNPDGYEYTRKKRLWRKNMARNYDGSMGVDLNRNFDVKWGKVRHSTKPQIGASPNPRSESYQGPYAFSEPETKALSSYILSIENRYAAIDFHSYGQLILRNWGYETRDSKNEAVLKKLGDGMALEIRKASGKRYTSQKSADLYPAGGCEDDWLGVNGMISFTIELRDKGIFGRGFLLPPDQIIPMGKEIWAAMKFFMNFIASHEIGQNE